MFLLFLHYQAAKKKERKKPADGYDQVTGILYKTFPVNQFVQESYDSAVTILATHNLLSFAGEASEEYFAFLPEITSKSTHS